MKIKILDRASLGSDTPFEGLSRFGEVEAYDNSTPNEVLDRIADAEIIIVNKIKITREVIEKAGKLRLICVFATGYDNIDLYAVRERNIAVCNVPGYSTDSVALFTVSTALALYSHLKEYNRFVSDGSYTASGVPNRLIPIYHELRGKTWGIIGCGNIGSAVARVATAFGARVIVNQRRPIADYEYVDIDTLCKESDIITIHCPLNEESRDLINADRIALMKEGAVIVNEARGAVVNDKDITDAILNKRIGAFGADVYTQEPFGPDHPFYKIKEFDNVIFTPHAAWGSYESRVRCINIICDNIDAFINGKTLNRVDILRQN